ncbi:MAG: hypothetical protein LBD33_01500, partial [Puniceicoccales bacterium]|nr:hypothetical protein [Puniceicoccales bacterium]
CHRCYDTIVTISNQQSKAVPFDRLLSALKAMANYAEVNGLGETDVIDKDFIARISQQILLEEPIKLVGERLKVSPEGMAKFNTCVLLCIDRENIEIFSSIANPRYESKALSARETDYLKWSRDVIQHVSSAPSPAPNTAIFSAAGVKDFTTQKVILRSLMRFCELVEVETRH